jgi:hypothetical protein
MMDEIIELNYGAKIEPDGNGYLVSCKPQFSIKFNQLTRPRCHKEP